MFVVYAVLLCIGWFFLFCSCGCDGLPLKVLVVLLELFLFTFVDICLFTHSEPVDISITTENVTEGSGYVTVCVVKSSESFYPVRVTIRPEQIMSGVIKSEGSQCVKCAVELLWSNILTIV